MHKKVSLPNEINDDPTNNARYSVGAFIFTQENKNENTLRGLFIYVNTQIVQQIQKSRPSIQRVAYARFIDRKSIEHYFKLNIMQFEFSKNNLPTAIIQMKLSNFFISFPNRK